MHLSSYLFSAQQILQLYQGEMPLAAWLKTYFRQHKKYGSKDRKVLADLCFCFFRLGGFFRQHSTEERLLTGQLLCHHQSPFVQEFKPEWTEKMPLSIEEKISFLDPLQVQTIFPFTAALSSEIDPFPFAHSFLQQPDLFLRIRPHQKAVVMKKLAMAQQDFALMGEDALRLPNSAKADEILALDKEVVVQDLSSQQVLQPLQMQPFFTQRPATVWDCCAASGGKSILAVDRIPVAQLTVSDVRPSILSNLQKRFQRAGMPPYRSFVADLSQPNTRRPKQPFDLVLCDAPCSGSGTWARTPEQLYFFSKEKIAHYTALQKSIAFNASKSLKKRGYFLYITCSVFRQENEEVVFYLAQHTGMQVLSQTYFKGYHQKADTLFAALFTIS